VPEYLRDAAVLARLGQLKCSIDCRCHGSLRYHEWAAKTNVRLLPLGHSLRITTMPEWTLRVLSILDRRTASWRSAAP
jgi:hypothetical protein